MDYPISGKAPDVAAASVMHALDDSGAARPFSAAAPGPVAAPAMLRATASPVVTTGSAYAAGNAVGGLLVFAGLARVAGQGLVLQTALLRDRSGNAAAYDLFLFDGAPAAPADKAAVALSAADLAKCIAVVPLAGAALGAAAGMGVIAAGGLGLACRLASGTTLWGILVTRGTPTFAGAADLALDLVALPD